MAPQQICSIPDCGNAGKLTRGWCTKHYQRWQNNGDPLKSRINRDQTGKDCKFDGCERTSGYKGYCEMHYDRIRRTGNPATVSTNPLFHGMDKWLDDHKSFDGADCLIWPFYHGPSGRGIARVDGKQTSAPNVMCRLAHGSPPSARHVAAHACGKGHIGCVHPKHLRWATRKENEQDRILHGTAQRGEKVNTSKLSETQVREIRRLSETMWPGELAKKFGVTKTTIWMIANRKSWQWLE